MVDQESEAAWRQVDRARNLLQDKNFSVQAAVMPGEVAVVTERYCEQERIDLLVMSSSEHSRIQNFFVGSTTSKTLRNATIPMLFLR